MSKAMDRLSKLIAQADNAGTDAERETFMAKAMEMSQAIGVELAAARAHHAGKQRELPVADHKVQVNAWLAKPVHRKAMMDLFLAIAAAHDVECLIGGDSYQAFCFGLPSDIEMCEKLFSVLSYQMVREADAAIKRGDQKKGSVINGQHFPYQVDGRVYRRYFYQGFVARVSGRLAEARREEIRRWDEMAVEAGVASANTGLVLRDKKKEIQDFYQDQIKHMKLSKGGYSGLARENEKMGGFGLGALDHGRQAADRANLGLSNRDVDSSGTREIGS